jgi:hypothetical protein
MVRIGVDASVHSMVKGITLENQLGDEIEKHGSVLKKEQQEFEGYRTSTASPDVGCSRCSLVLTNQICTVVVVIRRDQFHAQGVGRGQAEARRRTNGADRTSFICRASPNWTQALPSTQNNNCPGDTGAEEAKGRGSCLCCRHGPHRGRKGRV